MAAFKFIFFNYMINKINICKKRYEEKMYFLVNIIFLIHVFFFILTIIYIFFILTTWFIE